MSDVQALHANGVALPPSLLGESPLWHPDEQQLYWCDIPGRQLNRFDPASGQSESWQFDCEPSCCVPPLAACVLQVRVPVSGLPACLARL